MKKKTRVTIRLDDDLVAFFRKTGKDWQPRLNAVVRAFFKARLADMVRGMAEVESEGGALTGHAEASASLTSRLRENATVVMLLRLN